MALFHPNLVRLMREKLFTDLGTSAAEQDFSDGTVKVVSFHSGPQPTANDAITNWGTTYHSSSTTFLAITSSLTFNETKNGTGTDYSYTLDQVYPSNTAFRAGTATWAIIYQNATSIAITSATLQAASTVFTSGYGIMVVPVSDLTTSTGVFKLLDNKLVPGGTFTITDFTLTFDIA